MQTSATIRAARDADAGFSLIELMLALAVIALVAAIALPRANFWTGSTALRAKAYEAAALLRADRTAAQRAGRTVETAFDPAGRVLRSGATRAAVTLPVGLAARMDGPYQGFRFFADGRSSGGSLALASRSARLDLRVDGFTSAVEILSPSGGVR